MGAFFFYIMALASTLTQLEEVQAAITAVLNSQSYRIGDITYTRADLDKLTGREETLLARYNRENRGSAITRVNISDGI
jgi:hypothetical protein